MTQTGEQPGELSEWPRTWTHTIGRAVAHWRGQRGVSAQVLSDRCTALGYPVPRSTITNLETGRKEGIPVHEVVVLARALDVPPIALLVPSDLGLPIAVLPRRPDIPPGAAPIQGWPDTGHPYTVWTWFIGINVDEDDGLAHTSYARHVLLYNAYLGSLQTVQAHSTPAESEALEASRLQLLAAASEAAEAHRTTLQELRAAMRAKGVLPPDLGGGNNARLDVQA